MKRSKILQLRALIEQAAASLPDEDALEGVELFPAWAIGADYDAGERVRYTTSSAADAAPSPQGEGSGTPEEASPRLYKCIQGHTSQADWTPDKTPALWTEVAKPGEIPVWKQPTGAQDAYMTGDKVHYPDKDGPVYVSEMDYNTWPPDVYGWTELQT